MTGKLTSFSRFSMCRQNPDSVNLFHSCQLNPKTFPTKVLSEWEFSQCLEQMTVNIHPWSSMTGNSCSDFLNSPQHSWLFLQI